MAADRPDAATAVELEVIAAARDLLPQIKAYVPERWNDRVERLTAALAALDESEVESHV